MLAGWQVMLVHPSFAGVGRDVREVGLQLNKAVVCGARGGGECWLLAQGLLLGVPRNS